MPFAEIFHSKIDKCTLDIGKISSWVETICIKKKENGKQNKLQPILGMISSPQINVNPTLIDQFRIVNRRLKLIRV